MPDYALCCLFLCSAFLVQAFALIHAVGVDIKLTQRVGIGVAETEEKLNSYVYNVSRSEKSGI